MLNRRLDAAKQVAAHLRETERGIDHAISSTARLISALPEARLSANLSAVVGQDALDSVVLALSGMTAVRRQIVTGHAQLDELRHQIGLGTRAFGDEAKIPSGALHAVPLNGVEAHAA